MNSKYPSMFTKPQKTLNVATARKGRVRFVYELFGGTSGQHRFQIWSGRRCLLEIFDTSCRVPIELPKLIDASLAPSLSQAQKELGMLSIVEKFACYALGRGAVWVSNFQELPEHQRALKLSSIVADRRAHWKLLRLRGWGSPRILLLVNTWVGGSTFMGSNSTTTLHTFAMSLSEARSLRDALIALQTHPEIVCL
jgi:hypothetical protein